jgi:hypothetical protein
LEQDRIGHTTSLHQNDDTAPLYLLKCLLPAVATMIFYVLLAVTCDSQAAGDELEAKVKAAYIYNFTKFIDWEPQEGDAGTDPITICVLGTDPIGDILEKLPVQATGRPLRVKKATKEKSTFTNCHVLFICRSEQQQIFDILKKLRGAHVLTVSDIPRFTSNGGIIGFIIEDGRVKIEINLREAQRVGLKISAKLLEVARIVQ